MVQRSFDVGDPLVDLMDLVQCRIVLSMLGLGTVADSVALQLSDTPVPSQGLVDRVVRQRAPIGLGLVHLAASEEFSKHYTPAPLRLTAKRTIATTKSKKRSGFSAIPPNTAKITIRRTSRSSIRPYFLLGA